MTHLRALLLSHRGRIGRQTYWTLALPIAAASIVLMLVPFFGPLVSLQMLWPSACLVTKRLHDAGRRAWPVPIVAMLGVGAGLLSFAATVMATDPASIVAAFGLATPSQRLSRVSALAWLAVVLAAGAMRSVTGANRYGEPEAAPVTVAMLLRA